ncbi:MAG: hypothetical protein WCP39_00750 [Chlamydiota bacterium]
MSITRYRPLTSSLDLKEIESCLDQIYLDIQNMKADFNHRSELSRATSSYEGRISPAFVFRKMSQMTCVQQECRYWEKIIGPQNREYISSTQTSQPSENMETVVNSRVSIRKSCSVPIGMQIEGPQLNQEEDFVYRSFQIMIANYTEGFIKILAQVQNDYEMQIQQERKAARQREEKLVKIWTEKSGQFIEMCKRSSEKF